MNFKYIVGNIKAKFFPCLSVFLIGIVVLTVGLLLSCGSGEDDVSEPETEPEPSRIVITALKSQSVTKGDDINLSIEVEYLEDPKQAIAEGVVWGFEPVDGAFVGGVSDNKRVVTMLKAGELKIVATYKGLTSPPVTLDVIDSDPPVVSTIMIVSENSSVSAGKTLQLAVTSNLGRVMTEQLTWQSSDPALARVNDKGFVEALLPEPVPDNTTVTITATYTGVSPSLQADYSLEIKVFKVRIEAPDTLEWPIGVVESLTVFVDDDGNEQQDNAGVSWKISGDENVVAETAGGKLRALAEGNVMVHAEVDGVRSINAITITVVPVKLHEIILSPDYAALDVGERQLFTPKGIFTDNTEVADMSDQVACVSSEPDVFRIIEGCEGEVLKRGQAIVSVEPQVDTYQLINASRIVLASKAVHIGHFYHTQPSQTFSQAIPEPASPGEEPNPLYAITGVVPGSLYTLIMSSNSLSPESQILVAMDEGAENVCPQQLLANQSTYCSFQAKTATVFIDIVDEAGNFIVDFAMYEGGSVYSRPFIVAMSDERSYSIFDGVEGESYTYRLVGIGEASENRDHQGSVLFVNQGEARSCLNIWPQDRQSVACVVAKQADVWIRLGLSLAKLDWVPELQLEIMPRGFKSEGTAKPVQLALDVEHDGEVVVNSYIDKRERNSRYKIQGLKQFLNPEEPDEEKLVPAYYEVVLLESSEVVFYKVRRQDWDEENSVLRDVQICRKETRKAVDGGATEIACEVTVIGELTTLLIEVIGSDGFGVSSAASQGGASYKIVVRRKVL